MYCCRCGAELPAQARFCRACGQPVDAGAVLGRWERHASLLVVFWGAYGLLELARSSLRLLVGRWLQHDVLVGWGFPERWFSPLLLGIGAYAFLFGVASLVGAWGARQREAWARPLLIILAILALFEIPLGTALGLYTLWVLWQPQGAGVPSQSSR